MINFLQPKKKTILVFFCLLLGWLVLGAVFISVGRNFLVEDLLNPLFYFSVLYTLLQVPIEFVGTQLGIDVTGHCNWLGCVLNDIGQVLQFIYGVFVLALTYLLAAYFVWLRDKKKTDTVV